MSSPKSKPLMVGNESCEPLTLPSPPDGDIRRSLPSLRMDEDLVQHSRPENEGRPIQQHEVADTPSQSKDQWTAAAYQASASFVPLMTQDIQSWLDPQTSDTILDLGCGDGVLTSQIAQKCPNIVAVDASSNFVSAARKTYGEGKPIHWHVLDCRYMEESGLLVGGCFTKVFSNAALHWILRDPSTKMSVLRGVYRTLRPGGLFVFEMGGAGNVAEVHTAFLAALVHQGVGIEDAREASPWFFPSIKLIEIMLRSAGFYVIRTKADYRPTELTVKDGGGLEGWVRLMGAQFLEVLDTEEKREAVVREVCDVLKTVIGREDGSMWLGYVRLKVVARKPNP
ncbi:hypothetical protein MMC21_000543 [Puttea exsequens]|nr:hypothetical protein [Puttea exsequens]